MDDKLKFSISQLSRRNNCSSFEVKSNVLRGFCETGIFSVVDLKYAPSILRYTPLPNSTEWFPNISQTKVASVIDHIPLHNLSTTQLSIAIPEAEVINCEMIPPPELTIAKELETNNQECAMECSPIQEEQNLILMDDLERNSNTDTLSVASDLTRMCVSDEEEKVILVIEKADKNS